MTPDISPEREAELRAWLVRFDADPKNANIPSWTRDLLAMLFQARSDAAFSWNLTKMRLQELIQNEPEGEDAAADVFERVITCFRRLKKERDEALEVAKNEKAEHERTVQRFHWGD